jgi:hypothetical protein
LENNQRKIGKILPLFYSNLKQNLNLTTAMTSKCKGTIHNVSYVLDNFDELFKNNSKTKLKIFRNKLKSLQFYSNKIKNYMKINNSLNLLVNNNSNNNIKNLNYIRIISKYNPGLAEIKNNIYNFNNTKLIKNIYTLLYSAFISMRCLISQPRIYYTNDKIFIQLFFYPDVNLSKQMKVKWNQNIINKLLNKLSSKSKKEIINSFKLTYFNSKQKIIKIFNKLNFNDQKEVIKNFTIPSKKIKNLINIIIKRNESLKMSDSQAQKKITNLFNNTFINYNKPIHYCEENFNKNNLQNNSIFLIIYNQKLNNLTQLLSNIFNKPVQLELIRLHYPFYDPNIIVNLLSYFSENIKIRRLLGKIYKSALITKPTAIIQRKRFSVIPGYLTGLTIKFAGRFPTQKIVPRKTVKTEKIGSLARKKAVLIETARFSNKNRRGSFTISVSTGLYLNNFLN